MLTLTPEQTLGTGCMCHHNRVRRPTLCCTPLTQHTHCILASQHLLHTHCFYPLQIQAMEPLSVLVPGNSARLGQGSYVPSRCLPGL